MTPCVKTALLWLLLVVLYIIQFLYSLKLLMEYIKSKEKKAEHSYIFFCLEFHLETTKEKNKVFFTKWLPHTL